MPFKSKAQLEKMRDMAEKGEIKESVFKEKLAKTPHPERLPDRVTKVSSKVTKIKGVKKI